MASRSKCSNFSVAQLERYGWRQGRGLGKSENGMVESIRVKKKTDTHGLGSNATALQDGWWDQLYNKTLSNINHIAEDDDGSTVSADKAKNPTEESNKTSQTTSSIAPLPSPPANNRLYNMFVKGSQTHLHSTQTVITIESTSQAQDEQQAQATSDDDDDDQQEEDEKERKRWSSSVREDKLFEQLGGRMLRRYVPEGKLKRIQQQEERLLLFNRTDCTTNSSPNPSSVDLAPSSTTSKRIQEEVEEEDRKKKKHKKGKKENREIDPQTQQTLKRKPRDSPSNHRTKRRKDE